MGHRLPASGLAALAAGLLAAAAAQAAFPPPQVAAPEMRIGLSGADSRVIVLAAAGGLRLVDAVSGEPVWLESYRGDTRVVLLGTGEARTVFRVQVASFAVEATAQELAEKLAAAIGEPAGVRHDSQRRLYRVRVGGTPSRAAASALAARLADMGHPDAWVAEEAEGDATGAALRVVDADFREQVISPLRLAAFAAGGGPVSLGERRYRGWLEIFVDDAGRLRVVNRINLEDYLRGVVPDEMGPKVFPELEALKAQAVAARTYAVANRGQYRDDGYDICDTPRCQVYGGLDSEQPLTDRAVDETRGLVLLDRGRPANAMFTSTCGGHTEDVGNVFPEQDEPYLKGVVCAPERTEREQVVGYLEGLVPATGSARESETVRLAARLAVRGVLDPGRAAAIDAGPLATEDWRGWLQRLAPQVGREADSVKPAEGALTRGAMARDLVALMGWEERMDRLFASADAAVLLGLAPDDALPRKVRAAGGPHLALLVREGLLDPPGESGAAAWEAPVAAAEAALVLGRLAERYAEPALEDVRVREAGDGKLVTEDDETLVLAAGAFLFAATADGPAPVARLAVTRHEPLLIHRSQDRRIDYVEGQRPFRSLGDDRFSSRHNWEVRLQRGELTKLLGRVLAVGEVNDLEVVRRGVSGRVAELNVRGSRGQAALRGFDIRTTLGLMETLFTIERLRDERGRVRTFVFAGKGWGHGVGLCQVGAFGMAVRGRSYEEILKHYYTGIDLVRIQDRPALMQPTLSAP